MNKLKFPNSDNIAYDYCINLSCRPEYKIVAIALKCILYRNLFKKE